MYSKTGICIRSDDQVLLDSYWVKLSELLEDSFVWNETNSCPGIRNLWIRRTPFSFSQSFNNLSFRKLHRVFIPIWADRRNIEMLRKSVTTLSAHPVHPSCSLPFSRIKVASTMETSKEEFHCRHTRLLMIVLWNSSTIIHDGDPVSPCV